MNLYEVLRQPVVTEKSNYQNASLSQYVFEVASGATKTEIKDAIEKLFEVEVVAVNTLRMPSVVGVYAKLQSAYPSTRKQWFG
jgi:large subunit ribosomal protein L23